MEPRVNDIMRILSTNRTQYDNKLSSINWLLKSAIDIDKYYSKEITDADIEAYFKTWQNPRVKSGDEQYEKWLNKYLDELIDSAIQGAKAVLNGEIKHIEK